MKILLTVHQFFPEYCSGTEVLTFSVAKELIRRGHQVFVLTGFPARKQLPDIARFDEYDIEGMHVFRFQHSFVPMGSQSVVTEIEYNNLLAARYFSQILQRIVPDIVHFFHLSRLGAGLIDVASAADIPAYYTPTDFWSVCPTSQLLLDGGRICRGPSAHGGNCVKHVAALTRGPRVAKVVHLVPDAFADTLVKLTVNRLLPVYPLSLEIAAMGRRRKFNVARLNALHGIFSPTRLMTEVLVENGVDERLITQSAYGIDVADYGNQLRAKSSAGPTIFGFIGTLAPHKGCHVLIDAFKRIDSDRARLKIYGNPREFPDYFSDLQKRANGVATIEFCGTFPNARIAEILAGIDALVVPSLWYENTPLVVYSALAAKCPVVASDFPGISEVIRDNWNGLVFPPGDATGLHRQLTRIMDEPGLLTRLSAHCERPKSTAEYVEDLLALYRGTQTNVLPRYEIPDRQTILPLDHINDYGYISGWAMAGFDTPSRVSVCVGDVLVGQTDQFLPRPDVREVLRQRGVNVKGAEFGFAVMFPGGAERAHAVMKLEARNGRVVELPLEKILCGSSVHIAGGDLVGIDEECFDPMK